MRTVNIYGSVYRFTYDDEDRLASVAIPGGPTDTFLYNGLGLRVGKTDSTGSYAYFTDGTSPASDVLSDNFSTFTPGISETKGVGSGQYASVFYLADASGNSRGLLNGSQSVTDGYNWDAFGTLVSRFGSHPTGYAWEEGSGYQTDADTGLKLLGHRYYDSRLGRFLSQDPAGSGGNWYAYADNDPVNNTDPTGLVIAGGGWGGFVPDSSQSGVPYDPSQDNTSDYLNGNAGTYNEYINGAYQGTKTVGGLWDSMNNPISGGSPGAGFFMPAKGNVGHTDGNDALGGQIGALKQQRHGGGLTPQERAALDKQINDLEKKKNTNDKASKDRKSRAQKFVSDPTPSLKFNPAWTPTVTPNKAATTSTIIVIVGLVLLKIITGPLPVP